MNNVDAVRPKKISKKKMLEFLRNLYFKKVTSKEEISFIYRFVIGEIEKEENLMSKSEGYSLTVKGKILLKIYLQNQDSGVIYFCRVKFKPLWRYKVKDYMSDTLLDMALLSNFYGL